MDSTNSLSLPVESVFGAGLEEVNDEEELVGGGIDEMLQNRSEQHLEGILRILGSGYMHKNRFCLNLQIANTTE